MTCFRAVDEGNAEFEGALAETGTAAAMDQDAADE
jgi:hypothetical protein